MSKWIFTAKCEKCGEEYDNYMRTLFVEEKGKRTCVCLDCRKKWIKDRFWYINHIPPMCDGGNLVARVFDSLEELQKFVVNNTAENDIATFSDYNIVDVRKDKEFWWVRGGVSHKIDLPDFNETRKSLGYK